MESKKINQLATSVAPQTSDLTIIGDPTTGVSKKITLLQIANLFATTGTVSSVAVTESGEALTITGSPITSTGTINIGFAGDATQYVRGDGALADFPTSTGGGSSVSYYLNSSVSQGTIGGVAYRELSKDPISGAGTDITISADGYVASYITDANDPALLEVPGGNFNCEFYFSVNSNAHNPNVYAELYKYDGSTFTLLGSSQSVPEYLSNGTTLSPYYFAVPVATSVLTVTDRIAIRIYVDVDTRIVTLHTENNHLCQIVTTFSKGLISLNNLTRQNQFFATGSSGTDFAISSTTDTHTFNLPVASAANTGKLSSTDWSVFNSKEPAITAGTTLQYYRGDKTFQTLNTTAVIEATNLYFTDARSRLALSFVAGSGAYNSTTGVITIPTDNNQIANGAGYTTNVGTVTSVAASAGTGITISGSPITTSGTLTITNSAPDQVVALTASTGIAISGTYPNFTITNTSPSSGGTVTSVGLSSATSGVTIGSSPVTTSGTITLAIATASGSLNGLLSSTDWTTFNSKQATITLTTTGTSGAATFTSNTLNIPDYGSALSGYLPLSGGTLTGALSGTSATFSGTVTANTSFSVAGTNASPVFEDWLSSNPNGSSTLTKIQIGNSFNSSAGTWMKFSVNSNTAINTPVDVLTLSYTGAATFASLVRVEGQYVQIVNSTNPSLYINNNVVQWQKYVKSNNNFAISDAVRDVLTLGYNGSASFIQGGDFGIGTSSPSSFANYTNVTIKGGSSGANLDMFNSAGTRLANFVLNGSTSAYIGTVTDIPFDITQNDVTRMRITGGNVLIGTTTDQGTGYKLQVNTGTGQNFNVSSDGTNSVALMNFNTANGFQQIKIRSSVFTVFTGTAGGSQATERLTIAADGVTKITNLAGSGSRSVNADASGNLSASSDSSLKQEDTNHQIEGLAEILQLQPRAYKWKSDIEIRGEDATTEIGFFANEVNAIIPSAAPKGNDDLYGFYDRAVIAALVKAVQEQDAKIEELKALIEAK